MKYLSKLSRNQTGFETVAVVVIVAVLAVVGFAGYKVTQNRSADTATTAASKTTAPATISSQADLTATSKSLDNASTQVDSGVNGDSLDSDINDLL